MSWNFKHQFCSLTCHFFNWLKKLFLFYKYKNLDTIAVSLNIFLPNFILFTFSVLPSVNWSKTLQSALLHCKFQSTTAWKCFLIKILMGLMFFVQIFHNFCYKMSLIYKYIKTINGLRLYLYLYIYILSFLCYKIIRLVSVPEWSALHDSTLRVGSLPCP
jgi:hypothetical protein